VRCQIWSAICAYLMVAITRKRLKIDKTLNEILQIVSVSIFEQVPLNQLLIPTRAMEEQKAPENEIQNTFIFNKL
jgi:hypothetical protein